MKIRSAGRNLSHVDGQRDTETDVQDVADSNRLPHFENAPKSQPLY
jgi:hypothetical protein